MAQQKKVITFIDLFAGIGGFHLAFHNAGAKCVFVSEWDAAARKTYETNYRKLTPDIFTEKILGEPSNFAGDITKVDKSTIPNFDVLTGGFPCQPFSQAGHKRGFDDTRGTLFYDIAKILEVKKPKAFFIENVRGLYTHDDGKTFKVIQDTIEGLGYSFYHKIVKASDYGLPQHRPRLYMVGFRDKDIQFKFPEPKPLRLTMSDVFCGKVEREVGFTLRVGGRGSGLHDRRNWDAYLVDGVEKRLSPKEGLRMQGFPDDFVFPVTNAQAMKQLGNSVAVDAIQAFAEEIVRCLQKASK
jgi:DNA (cytosine-5)-methyltransferase 1